ncbi:MAG TPA: nucleolar RNA-binding Nop10p family protein [Candidatus Nanoarchaeia archaeon]|nr:nucleolar RNA-binding Nop10p family protein [Candidatus Nanoarchaeia archaeon]
MAEHIHKCLTDLHYTIAKLCPLCNTTTILPRPPKFSLQDKYAALRREEKKKELKEKKLY